VGSGWPPTAETPPTCPPTSFSGSSTTSPPGAVVPLTRTFDPDGIALAHTRMEHGSAGGKLVVIPDTRS
jgi:hypothetical protein